MLRNTFVHFPGVGVKTEKFLWNRGVFDWESLSESGVAERLRLRSLIQATKLAYQQRDVDFFYSRLPAGDRWRVLIDFADLFVAIDIETTGLSIYDYLTVVGVDTQKQYHAFVRGVNLDSLQGILNKAKGIVTFNGAQFDLPFLKRSLPEVTFPEVHIDLRHLARRLGFAGSLKRVEEAAGFKRPGDLKDVSGYQATVLWNQFEHGDEQALETLLRYNSSDTCVLRPLAQLFADQLVKKTFDVTAQPERSFFLRLSVNARLSNRRQSFSFAPNHLDF